MNTPTLLSGSELVENGGKKAGSSLPPKSTKQIIPNGSWLEKKQIENGLDIKRRLIADQRIEKKNALSQAEWNKDIEKALVTEKKGNCWNYIGHVDNSNTYIYPEEALHLMEMNNLLLKFGGVIVSIQQAYTLLIGKSISLYEYRVYSSLMRDGYRLLRHENNETVTNGLKKESKKVSQDNVVIAEEKTNGDNIESTESKNENVLSKKSDESSLIISDDDSNDCLVIVDLSNDCNNSSRKRKLNNDTLNMNNKKCIRSENVNEVKLSNNHRLKCLDSIVNCFQKKVVHIPAPDKKYIPSNINLPKKNYFIKLIKAPQMQNNQSINNDVCRIANDVVNRYSRVVCNSQMNQTSMPNLFMNNSFFFNHIFQQISVPHSNMYFSRYSCTQFNNTIIENNSSYKCNSSRCHPPPFLSRKKSNKNSHQHRSIIHNTASISNIESEHNDNIIVDLDNVSNASSKTENKYEKLLRKAKNILSQKDLLKIDSNYLNNVVKEYNLLFDQNYIINNNMFPNRESSDKIVNLSSDSNDSNELPSSSTENKSNKNVEVVPSSEIGTSSKISSDESDLELTSLESERIDTNDQRIKLFSSWLTNDLWNKPEVSPLKSKRNSQILKLSKAFLNTAKKFSFDNQSGILSWKEAREFYDKINTENTVSISDDEEIEKNDCNEMDYTIKLNKMQPLIRPQDCVSVSTVLNRLKVIDSLEGVENVDEKLVVLYDVYKPNVKGFRKTAPSYCLVIRSLDSSVPDSRNLIELRSRVPNGVKLLFAIVSVDSIFFLQMEDVQLPMMIEDIEN